MQCIRLVYNVFSNIFEHCQNTQYHIGTMCDREFINLNREGIVVLRAWPFPSDMIININSLRPRPNRRHFADDIFKRIFENENEWISPRVSLKFVPDVRINNIPALVQIMAWRRPGDKPLSEPMMVSLLTHICVTRPRWVNEKIWLYGQDHCIHDITSITDVYNHLWHCWLHKGFFFYQFSDVDGWVMPLATMT